MFLGTQYYRPENPEIDLWEQDFQAMKKMGLTVVRCWLYWRKVEFEENQWDFKDYDRFFALASVNELKVLVQMVPECQPEWFLQRYRKLWPVDQAGNAYPQHGFGMVAVGGYPGVSFDHEVVKEHMKVFFEKAVERYKDHPALFAWDIWNEIIPHFGQVSYDATTEKAFQKWLEAKYETIENFNKYHRMFYQSFTQIPTPKEHLAPGTILMILFDKFRADRLCAETERRVRIIKHFDNVHLVVAHFGMSTFCGGDESVNNSMQNDWALAGLLDRIGTSHYMTEMTRGTGNDYYAMAVEFSFLRSSSGNKPWWLAEHTGGQVYYHYGHHLNSVPETKSSILLAFAHGAEAAIYWQYRSERYGTEAPGWGLVNFDGSMNERTKLTRLIANALERESVLLQNVKRPVSTLGIIYDMDSKSYEKIVQTWEKQRISIGHEIAGWHKACMDAGVPIDIYSTGQIIKHIPDECKVLYLPVNMVGNTKLYESLVRWVENGGTLVVSAYAGTFDEQFTMGRTIPLAPLSVASGVKVLAREYPGMIEFDMNTDDIKISGIKSYWVHEILETDKTQIAAVFNGYPAVTYKQQGKGYIWYIASCPGMGYKLYGGNLPQYIKKVVERSTDFKWIQNSIGVLPEIALGDNLAVLYLTNPSDSARTVTILGSCMVNGMIRNMISGENIGSLEKTGDFKLDVPARDTLWLAIVSCDVNPSA